MIVLNKGNHFGIFYFPEVFFFIAIILFLIFGLVIKSKFEKLIPQYEIRYEFISWCFLVSISLFYFLLSWKRVTWGIHVGFKTFLVSENYSLIYQAGLSLVILIFFLSLYSQLEVYGEHFTFEASFVLLINVFFLNLLILHPNFIVIFLAIEVYNISAVFLIANVKTDRSLEGGLKYFFIGTVSSLILLFGLFLIYWQTSVFNLPDLVTFCGDFLTKESEGVLPLGLIFVVLGLLIKLGLPPFHAWLIEIYDAIPYYLVFYFSLPAKLSFFLFFIKLYNSVLMVVSPELFKNLFIFIVIQSLVVGCFGALYHTRLKRIFGFSSIFNVAAMLIPVVFSVDKEFCYAVLYTYIVFYTLTMIGIFLILMYAQDWITNRFFLKIEDLVFLKNSNRFLAMSFCFCILSLAGIPPGGLFFSKFFLMFFVGCETYTGLVIVCIFFILNSVSMFYYFRLIKLVVIVPKPTDCLLIRNLNYGVVLILVLVLISLVLLTIFYANLFDFFLKIWLS